MRSASFLLIALMCAAAAVAQQIPADVPFNESFSFDTCGPFALSIYTTGPAEICSGETAEIVFWVWTDPPVNVDVESLSGCPICSPRTLMMSATGEVGYPYQVVPQGSTLYSIYLNFEYCGYPIIASASHLIAVNECGIATLGQGFWGNANRASFLGTSGQSLLTEALDPPIVVGMSDRSLRFGMSSTPCVIQRLPAGGQPRRLPLNLVSNYVQPPECQPVSPVALDRNGRFHNSLLGQTFALAASSRIGRASNWRICRSMSVDLALPGPDGVFGSPDDCADEIGPDLIPYSGDEVRFAELPEGVLVALANLGLTPTANDLLELANRALGGLPTGGASLQDINTALEKFNGLFENGAILRSCSP